MISKDSYLQILADEIYKPPPTIKKSNRYRKVVSMFPNETHGLDLADMTKYKDSNKNIKFLLICVDIFSRYAWVEPLKTKNADDVLEAIQKIHKKNMPHKIWVDNGSEFYNTKMKEYLDKNDITIYSTYGDSKSVVAERFIKTLREKIYKYLQANGTFKYIDKLDDIVDTYNHTTHSTLKMSPIEAREEQNYETILRMNEEKESTNNPKFKINDWVRIFVKKDVFQKKTQSENWSFETFQIEKIHQTSPFTYTIKDRKGETIQGSFYEWELQPTLLKDLRFPIVLKSNKNKQFVKYLGFPISENEWIDKE